MGVTLRQAIPMIICAALLTAMPIIGIIGYIMTRSAAMLILTVCSLVFAAGALLFLHFMISSTADKLRKAYDKQSGLVCAVSEKELVIVRDNKPVRVIGWENITNISEGKNAYYLKENNDGLIILDKEAVLSGSINETAEIIAQKTRSAE